MKGRACYVAILSLSIAMLAISGRPASLRAMREYAATRETMGLSAVPSSNTTLVFDPSGHLQTDPLAVPWPDTYFPIGMFEDGNRMGQADLFETMLQDLQSRGLNAVMLTNTRVSTHAPLLDISDRYGVRVYYIPAWDLDRNWWPSQFPADDATALSVARPIVEAFSSHPSFQGYIVKDEPTLGALEKVQLLTQAFRQLDPSRPTMPILIGTNRVGQIFDAAQPDVMLIDVYPAGYKNAPCDFTLTGFGYETFDFVSYIRFVTQNKPAETPLWIILQTHKLGDGGRFSLREPSVSEVRMQHWLAIGEGATGIFWFIYTSQQGWVGLADNPTLFDEVTRLTRRTLPLRDLLLRLQKTHDHFVVTGAADPYVSTLVQEDSGQFYALIVNRDCQATRQLSIHSDVLPRMLRDVETGQMFSMGMPITLLPGDGMLLELIPPDPIEIPAPISAPIATPEPTLTSEPIGTSVSDMPSVDGDDVQKQYLPLIRVENTESVEEKS